MEEKIAAKGEAAYAAAVLIGTACALALLLILSLIAGAAVYLSPLSETLLSPVALGVDGAAAFCGGMMAGHSSGRRGLVMGAAVGVLMLALMLLPMGAEGGSSPTVKAAVCLLPAMIGGVLGVR